jgi:two-component sensor histidine kinase
MANPIPLNPAAAQGLAMALVAASSAPLLLLKGDLTVVAASTSFTSAFQIDPAAVEGRKFYELGKGEWGKPELRSLLNAAGAGDTDAWAYEMVLKNGRTAARQLLLHAQRLDYGDPANVRLLLTISDVTEARRSTALVDDLVRERSALIEAAQHRIANSLQVIASLLMLSARQVQSDETRRHLFDAQHRVMNAAAVQRQLAPTEMGEVELRTYFANLCQSLAAAMIPNSSQVALVVTVDDSIVAAEVSISLGLIVTELVINAVRHAFPDHRGGEIGVDYRTMGATWILSVRDDGVGKSANVEGGRPGLGTRIVEALAKHLHAVVHVSNLAPGTAVSVTSVPAVRFASARP